MSTRVALLLLLLGVACEQKHEPDRPGPPRFIHAYVVEAAYLEDGTASYLALLTNPTFDPTDPDAWKMVPDLLPMPPAGGPYAPPTLLRAITSELIEGDSVEDIDAMTNRATLKAGVITVSTLPKDSTVTPNAMAASPPLASYFDPSGSITTGPPGPALVMAPRPALPSNSTVTVTYHASTIKDTAGNAMAADATFSFETAAITAVSLNGDLLAAASAPEVAKDVKLTLGFNTLLATAGVSSATFELHSGDASGPLVAAEVAFDAMVGEAIGGVAVVTLTPGAPLAGGSAYAIVVRRTVVDLYDIPPAVDLIIPFKTAPSAAPDGGAG